MASARSRSLSRGGPSDGARRMVTHMDATREDLPPSLREKSRRAGEASGFTPQAVSQAKGSSRLPQSASARRPPLATQPERPLLGHQPQSWVSTGSKDSGRSASDTSRSHSSGNLGPSGSNQPRTMLRRKRSNIAQEAEIAVRASPNASKRTSSSSSVPRSQTSLDPPSSLAASDPGLTESPMEVMLAQRVDLPTSNAHTVTIYPELDRYRNIRPPPAQDGPVTDLPHYLTTHDLPPPTPLFSGTSSQLSGVSGSPSTRYSESPGPGPYSRDTTPTSISSHSPGLVAPMRIPATRLRQGSPAQTRPPVTARTRAGSIPRELNNTPSADLHGLAAVRESLTSSSSNSTVRDAEKKARKKKKNLPPLAPSPPPRKSSQKFKKNRDEEASPPKESEAPQRSLQDQRHQMSPSRDIPRGGVGSPRPAPPSRPSRDGTPDLHTQLGLPIPVIHSNLSSTSLTERRQSVGLAPSAMNRSITPSSLPDSTQLLPRPAPSREGTASQDKAVAPERRQAAAADAGRAVRTPSPSVSGFKSRFPLFSRRTKTAPEVPQVEPKEKVARKGPAAGTGHEGYGRIGAVRRRSSGTGNMARGLAGATMSSQESLAGSQSQDPFLMERMNPVVIAGGEVIENRNTSSELSRTESNLSLPFSRPSLESRNASQASFSPSRRRPSDSSDSEALAMKSTLAFRRSVQRLKTDEQPSLRLPKPIVTRARDVVSPSINSIDASILSDDSISEAPRGFGRGRQEPTGLVPKKLTKRARSPRKWNLFGRSTANKQPEAKTVAATVKVVQSKPVAFYTMMDSSEQEDGEPQDIEQVLREAQVLPVALPAASQVEKGKRLSAIGAGRRRPAAATAAEFAEPSTKQISGAVAQAPSLRYGPATKQSAETSAEAPALAGRPSRLAQVGRIPKVISGRTEPPSPRSFSRPFNRVSMQMQDAAPSLPLAATITRGPSPPRPSTPDLTHDGSTTTSTTLNSLSRYRSSREMSPDTHRTGKEFLAFSPRQSSQFTTTTTSSGSGIHTFSDATAVVPDSNAPLVEDEIWDEYNDLLGDETLKVPPSAGSSQGTPFHLEGYGSRLNKQVGTPLESPTINIHQPQSSIDAASPREKIPVASSVYSADMTTKVNEALEAAIDPTTPFSLSEFVSGYEDRRLSDRNSPPQSPNPERPRGSYASGSSGASSNDNSPLSQVNIRVGSMTVSKWLTFGHVLFSPAREDLVAMVGSLKRPSILVVDGLGNDDWSFYAAETYPAATFFNLSPRAPLPADHQSASTFPLSPPNHHQIQYMSHMDKFPFGPQSFTSVVYRFPAAGPESHYRNIISEARRVLKPGGYIELSMLDVDLNNMGNRCRRAVRQLKERVHTNAADTSLSSAADLVLRLLGRRGFVDIKTCRVGVPVASVIPKSSASEAGSGSNGKIAANGRKSGAKGSPSKGKAKRDDRSLAEMMQDESAVADESITKMVAKVGRWWYSRCYESAGPAAAPSIWSDAGLLAECEEWGTSLKLMVCHARVSDGRTRVASI